MKSSRKGMTGSWSTPRKDQHTRCIMRQRRAQITPQAEFWGWIMDPIQAVQYRWQDLGKIHVYEMKRNPFTKAVQPFPHFSSGRLTLILFLLRSIKDHSRPADIKRHFVMDFFSPLIYLAVQWLNVASSMTFHQCSFHSQKQTGLCLTQSFTHSCQQARVA